MVLHLQHFKIMVLCKIEPKIDRIKQAVFIRASALLHFLFRLNLKNEKYFQNTLWTLSFVQFPCN